MKKILLIGLGRVGYRTLFFLRELVKDLYSYVVDVDATRLEALRYVDNVETHLYEPGVLRKLGEKVDLAITALPSLIALRAILELISACINIVDVSFIPEDPYEFEKTLVDCSSYLVVDAGFAPGYSNLVTGYVFFKLGLRDLIEIRVGGIPDKPIPPIGYTITWNPRDLLEEYIRPARYIENYKVKAIKPINKVEKVEIDDLGVFEGFPSDGLRTMIRNIKARNIREITLRWPGHMAAIKLLYELGFLDSEEIKTRDTWIKPIDFTASILEKKLSMKVNDIAILQVIAQGDNRAYRELAVLHGAIDNPATPVFTALVHAYTAKLALEKKIKPGVVPLETLYEFKEEYEKYLVSKGVEIRKYTSE